VPERPANVIHAQPLLAADYDAFLGRYSGEATLDEDNATRRDLSVEIRESKNGFNVTWQTTTIRKDGDDKVKKYSIDFIPTERGGIYGAAMKTNVFGGREALDPLKGDPYVWARILGDTLTVHALIIDDEGDYEMQTYDRTLTDYGMHLRFRRIHEGEPRRLIEARLVRE
jgi:hypothetical protein